MKKPSKKFKVIMLLICAEVAVFLIWFAFLPLFNNAAMNKHLEDINTLGAVDYGEKAPPVPELEDGIYTFKTDRELKILQLTDIHLSGSAIHTKRDGLALNAAEKVIRGTKPDLVIVTGDLSYATPLSLTLDNSRAFKMFGLLMEKLGVYWTITYGNHDSEVYNTVSRADIGKIISRDNYAHSLFTDSYPDIYGEGNQFINVINSKNVITQTLALFDSNSYAKGLKGYDIIHDDQIAWYEGGIKSFSAYNKGILANLSEGDLPAPKAEYETVKSLAFFHIPLEEFVTAHDEYTEVGNIEGGDTEHIYGIMDEDACIGYASNQLFETMLELGSTKAIFVGHDHVNNTCYDYKGIKLVYSYSIDYLAYRRLINTDEYRGGTVIVVNPDASFTNELVAFSSIAD